MQLGPVMAMVSGPVVAQAIADPNSELAKLVDELQDDQELIEAVFLRILNRHADQEEIDAVQQLFAEIDADHQRLTELLQDQESQWAERKPELEAKRKAALTQAQRDLVDYQREIAPQTAQLELERSAFPLSAGRRHGYEKDGSHQGR